MNKINLEVYLFFAGNCREAMEFYKGVFGGELTMQTRGETDPEAPADMKDLLIHCRLEGGEINLMAADNTGAQKGPQDRISLSVTGYDEAKLRKMFDQLGAGGEVTTPLQKMFWGDTFGMLVDKYGINWMFNIGSEHEAPKS